MLSCWVTGQMKLCKHFKLEISVSYGPLGLLDIRLWFSNQTVGVCISGASPKCWSPWYGACDLCFSGICFLFVRSLPLVGVHIGGRVFGKTMSLHLLLISVYPFYPLLWRSCFSSFSHLFFQREFSICNCRFGVSLGGGKFRVFLCCHLELPTLSFVCVCVCFYNFPIHIIQIHLT